MLHGGAVGVSTGDGFFVWGGLSTRPLGRRDGAWYSIRDDRWRAVPPAPVDPISGAAAVWTGKEVLIWGRSSLAATRTDPVIAFDTRRWQWRVGPPAPVNALPGPIGGVWTQRAKGAAHEAEFVVLSDGLLRGGGLQAYRPAANTWRTLPSFGPNSYATLLWTGTELLAVGVAGERSAQLLAWRRRGDRWTRFALPPTVTARYWNGVPGSQSATWTGREVVVLAGATSEPNGAALRLVPSTGAWQRLPAHPAQGYGDRLHVVRRRILAGRWELDLTRCR